MARLDDIDKCRRDLYAVSFGILVFNIAGGELGSAANPFVLGITIARPWVLYATAAILLGYFVWRFCLALQHPWFDFKGDVDQEILRSRRFLKFTRARLTAAIGRCNEQIRNLKEVQDSLRLPTTFRFNERTFMSELYDAVGARGNAFVAFPHVIENQLKDARADVPWTPALRRMIVCRAVLRACWRRPAASDYGLPLLVAAIAALSAVARFSWRIYLHWNTP